MMPPANGCQAAASRLSGKAAAIEEFLLLRCHLPAENRIPMRKAAEAPDDVAVALRIRHGEFSDRLVQRHRAVLVGNVFGVRKWKIDESPELIGQPAVEGSGDRGRGNRTSVGIGGIHSRRT